MDKYVIDATEKDVLSHVIKMAKDQIDLAAQNRDRRVSIFASPEMGLQMSVDPWPDPSDDTDRN